MPRIEHIGSTAVPGLAAKATIDILCRICSFEEARELIVSVLEPEGYFCNLRENPSADHIAFWWGYFPDQPIRVHLHMAPEGHSQFDTLLFRDWLRAHPKTTRDYEKLKRQLEAEYRNDRDGYTEAKGDFFRKMRHLLGTPQDQGVLLSPALRRARCKKCPIYAEHQRLKYRLAAPLSLPVAAAVAWLMAGCLRGLLEGGVDRIDQVIREYSFARTSSPERFTALQPTLGDPMAGDIVFYTLLGLFALTMLLRLAEWLIFELQT